MSKHNHTKKHRLRPVCVHGLPKDFALGVDTGQINLLALKPMKTLLALLFDWLIIGLVIWFASRLEDWIVTSFAVVIIAGRQQALGILVHEAAHYRVYPSKRINDVISNCFMAFPLLLTTSSYRKSHMAHHLYLNTDRDPDWFRKKDRAEWKVPTSRGRLFWIILREGLGFGVWTIGKILMNYTGKEQKTPGPADSESRDRFRLVQLIYWVAILSLVFLLHGGMLFLTYWVVPLLFVLPVILKVRSLAEHFGLERQSDLDHSRNYFDNIVWLFLLAPHNANYHLDHHLFPMVPFYNLPKLHRILAQHTSYADGAHSNASMLSFRARSLLADLIEDER